MIITRRATVPAAVAVLLAGGFTALALSSAAAATPAGGYAAVTPTRLLDTRSGIGAPKAAVHGLSSIALQVGGRAGVPASGVSAVVLNVTVTSPASVGFVTAYADGAQLPTASNVNFVRGQTVPNLVVAPVGADGKVRLYNGSAGTVQLVADVSGYYLAGSPFAQGGFGAVTPVRRLDTRNGIGAPKAAVGGLKSVAFTVTGSGVPSQVSAVVLNVTAVSPTATGFVTAYGDNGTAAGPAPPSASNLNILGGQTVANLVVAPVGADGKVRLYNGSPGTVQLIADVSGYYTFGDPVQSGGLGSLTPARLLDTRVGTGATKAAVHAGSSVAFTVDGAGGVPLTHVSAVVLNVTAVSPTANGYVTAYADGASRPGVSNLNFPRGVTVPNLVLAPVGTDGKVRLYNGSSGTVQLIADVSGYVLNTPLTVPAVSTSRYVRNISGAASDVATMTAEGQLDAASGSKLVLLDIGAQLNNKTGVELSVVDTIVTYPQLVIALQAYLDGLGSVSGVTVAIGTSNDAQDWTTYPAAARGGDWASKVINLLNAGPGVTVVGADDIESGFGTSKVSDALGWEAAYLKATTGPLIFNGSANGCPSAYGANGACGASWTQAQYYALAGGGNTSRIHALPQIYNSAQAAQWANIDRVGGRGILFLGALTEHASVSSQFRPSEGWAAMYHGLSTLFSTPSVPAVTDLQVDD
jgi:hypothetical protein